MAVLMTLDIPGGTVAAYDRAREVLDLEGEDGTPPGLITHVCAVTDEGIVIVEAWDSVASLDHFAHDRLAAAFAEAGMPEATPQVSPVHALFFGAGKESNVLVLLDPPGFTPDEYEAVTARMPAHAGGGVNHPSVLHVAALEPDGHLRFVNLWDSEAAYREFIEGQLAPAVGDPRYFVVRLWPVHDCLHVRPSATA